MYERQQILETLRERLQEWQADCHCRGGIVSTGSRDLDQLLAKRGLEHGTLVEWIGSPGSGNGILALIAAREACGEQGILVVLDEKGDFYPPAAQAMGVDLRRTIVIQPTSARDRDWSLIQTLRSPGIAAVLSWPERINERMLRRLQLAAERSGAVGLLVRPLAALTEPSWAKVRLVVEAQAALGHERRWQVTIINSQASRREAIELEMDHETGKLQRSSSKNTSRPMPLAAPFTTPVSLRGATSA